MRVSWSFWDLCRRAVGGRETKGTREVCLSKERRNNVCLKNRATLLYHLISSNSCEKRRRRWRRAILNPHLKFARSISPHAPSFTSAIYLHEKLKKETFRLFFKRFIEAEMWNVVAIDIERKLQRKKSRKVKSHHFYSFSSFSLPLSHPFTFPIYSPLAVDFLPSSSSKSPLNCMMKFHRWWIPQMWSP